MENLTNVCQNCSEWNYQLVKKYLLSQLQPLGYYYKYIITKGVFPNSGNFGKNHLKLLNLVFLINKYSAKKCQTLILDKVVNNKFESYWNIFNFVWNWANLGWKWNAMMIGTQAQLVGPVTWATTLVGLSSVVRVSRLKGKSRRFKVRFL
jgi:hypothetical protein